VSHPQPVHLRTAPISSKPTSISAFVAFYQIASSLRKWKSGFKPGEKLLEVGWWKLVTTLRTVTYHELRARCRFVTETNDVFFERNFESDQTRRNAEAAENLQMNPPPLRYGRNLDFPDGGRR
jgi:hypothetical protein